ncbi:MAG: OmpA family protein, partial [Chlorobi bacterium]|nr:OmpA family protein [Chlorobiota bacterium]
VKSYLVKTWGIDPRRIRVVARNLPTNPTSRSTPEGQAENRRVEITTRDGRVLAPTTRNEIERRYNVAGIALYPVITAEAGLAQWSLTMRHGQSVVLDTSGTRSAPRRLAWTIVPEEFEKEAAGEDLVVSVAATDTDGQKKTARRDIPVKHLTVEKKRTQRIGDKIIARSRLIVFEFDKATLSPQNKSIIDEVRRQMTPDTKVQILGYTDRLGDPKHNLELSLRRAEAVRKALGSIIPDANVTVKGLGSTVLLFDNSTPEGRFYCRMVEIIAETPVKN